MKFWPRNDYSLGKKQYPFNNKAKMYSFTGIDCPCACPWNELEWNSKERQKKFAEKSEYGKEQSRHEIKKSHWPGYLAQDYLLPKSLIPEALDKLPNFKGLVYQHFASMSYSSVCRAKRASSIQSYIVIEYVVLVQECTPEHLSTKQQEWNIHTGSI